MKENIDSDFNPAMLASLAFENIIDKIRNSNLNFQLQMSPYSAQISLKKSLVTEKTGVPRHPSTTCYAASNSSLESERKNMQLESKLNNIKVEYDRVVDERDEAFARIKCLETEIERISIKHENENENITEIEKLQIKIKRLSTENIEYRELVKEQTEEINDLKNSVKIKTDISNQMNKKFSEFKIKSEKEKAVAKKSHQAEVKFWRKELGNERKLRIKLEYKLEKVMKEYSEKEMITPTPEYSSLLPTSSISHDCGNSDEIFEADSTKPEHNDCQHVPQCVIRQPFPPPSPVSPFIFHEVSKYHIHMMNNSVDDLAGCIRCFSVNNENYGCDKCTWLKWWFKWHGDRHAFPDIHPSVYKKYQ